MGSTPKGTETQVKGTEPEVIEPQVQPTEPEPKPTESKAFATEADFQRAVSKGLESNTRQLSLAQAEAKKAQAAVEQHIAEIAQRDAYIELLRKEVDEALTDDPERKQAYTSRLASLEREQKLAKKDAEAEDKLYQAEIKVWQAGMGLKAQDLDRKYPELKLDLKHLIETCATEQEMELEVLRLKLEAGSETEPPKVESGISQGSKADLNALTPKELLRQAYSKKK